MSNLTDRQTNKQRQKYNLLSSAEVIGLMFIVRSSWHIHLKFLGLNVFTVCFPFLIPSFPVHTFFSVIPTGIPPPRLQPLDIIAMLSLAPLDIFFWLHLCRVVSIVRCRKDEGAAVGMCRGSDDEYCRYDGSERQRTPCFSGITGLPVP